MTTPTPEALNAAVQAELDRRARVAQEAINAHFWCPGTHTTHQLTYRRTDEGGFYLCGVCGYEAEKGDRKRSTDRTRPH